MQSPAPKLRFVCFLNYVKLIKLLNCSMPDLSDVGPPATGPGLPQRIEEAPPPPLQVHIIHG